MEREIRQVRFPSSIRLERKKVAAYARVSSGKDTMLHSLSAQISYYDGLIRNNPEWEFAGVYADEAVTGTKSSRENFQRMLDECREGKIDIIITKSISRFARNTVTLLETIRELKGFGVAVIFEEQNINTMSADGELLITLLASFAQAESLSASENTKWSIRKGFEAGELMELHFMLGYDISKDGILINEEQANLVRWIYKSFLDGKSIGSIRRELAAKGITGIHGGRITDTSLRRILSNEKYIGDALLQKRYVNNHIEKKLVKNNGELPMYYAEDTHEAIIDKDTFDRVQNKLTELDKTFSDRAPQKHYPFTSRIRCAKCGGNFVRAYNSKPVWLCWTYRNKGKVACNAKQIPDYILIPLCCEVLGIDEFDEDVFNARINSLTADTDEKSNILIFHMKDGEQIVKRWKPRSRSLSWTPEMREKAREYGKKGGRKNGRKER